MTIKKPSAVESPYITTDTTPNRLASSPVAGGGVTTVAATVSATVSATADANANTTTSSSTGSNVSYYTSGIEGIAGLASSGRVFDGANVYVTLEQPQYVTYNQTFTIGDSISVTGNITTSDGYFIGDGSQLTGISSSGNFIVNGNSYANIASANGSLVIGINGGNTWTFNPNSALTAPGGSQWTNEANADAYFTSSLDGYVHLQSLFADGNIGSEVFLEHGLMQITAHSLGANTDYVWTFDNGGNLTLPGNTFQINYANGSPVSISGGGANIGNLDISGTLIEIAAGAPDTSITISPSGPTGGWAYLQLPTNGTANTANTRLHNDAGNIEFGTGDFSTGETDYIWTLGNDGTMTIPGLISSSNTMDLDNRASGNTADIRLFSADDIQLQGRDKPDDLESEGGDINIYAGIGSNATSTGLDTGGGGDIQIRGGTGGTDDGGTNGGSAGGFVSIRGGDGGGSVDSNAGGGGDINLTAGSASGAATTALGGLGGGVNIIAGTTTRINESGGSIELSTGGASGDGSGAAGYVSINIPSSNVGTGGQWIFSGTGTTLNVPANAEIFGASVGNFTVGCAGNTIITSSDYGANVQNWVFGYTGNLDLPQGVKLGDYPGVGSAANTIALSGAQVYLSSTNGLSWVGVENGVPLIGASEGIPTSTANINSQGGYNIGSYTGLSTTGGSGTGLTVNASTAGNGYINTVTINAPGSGYTNGDTITIVGGDGLGCTFTIGVPFNQWTFGTTGSLTLPTIDLGTGLDAQAVISSQRKLIPPLRYSAVIDADNPTIVYTATNVDTTSMKVTMQVQHAGLGMEFFEVFATFTGSDTFYTVNNRVAPPTIEPSTVVVGLTGTPAMKITVTVNSGAATSWVTYDAVEFGIAVD